MSDEAQITVIRPDGNSFGMVIPREQLRHSLKFVEAVTDPDTTNYIDMRWRTVTYQGIEAVDAAGRHYWIYLSTEK